MNASEPREDAVADSVWEAIRPYIQPSDKSHARVTLTRAIAALAQQGAEPVAWLIRSKHPMDFPHLTQHECDADAARERGDSVTSLYAGAPR